MFSPCVTVKFGRIAAVTNIYANETRNIWMLYYANLSFILYSILKLLTYHASFYH